jgi:hypothetical protein
MCKRKDETGDGDLKMDDLRAIYYDYQGKKFGDSAEVDKIFGSCKISIKKKGLISYSEWINIKLNR